MTSRSPSIFSTRACSSGVTRYSASVSLDCSVYWNSLLVLRATTRMFWMFWKNTATPGTVLAVRRSRWITAVEFSLRTLIGLRPSSMRP